MSPNDATADTDQVRALYRERVHLLAVLAALYPSVLLDTAPDLPEYALLVVHAPAGRMTWHIARRDVDLLRPVTERADPGHPLARWDGTDKAGTLRRLAITAGTLAHTRGGTR